MSSCRTQCGRGDQASSTVIAPIHHSHDARHPLHESANLDGLDINGTILIDDIDYGRPGTIE
jgi:hypothetical protein